MKYTIEGFQQRVLMDLHLDGTDAIILRYVIDFYNTGQMFHKIINNRVYFWVNFGTIIEELPILNIEKTRGISRRFDKFLECGLMSKDLTKGRDEFLYRGRVEKRHGTFTYFHIDPDIMGLLVREKSESDPYLTPYASKGSPSKGTTPEGLQGMPPEADRVNLKRTTKDTSITNDSPKDTSINAYKVLKKLTVGQSTYSLRDDRVVYIWDGVKGREESLADVVKYFPASHPVRIEADKIYGGVI